MTGEYLQNGLRQLGCAGVRGLGLFLGFDLPDVRRASELVNRMKESGVLLSTDGPRHDVIKIKPPIVFSRPEADRLLDRLAAVLPALH
jgi:4-aminobutyrate aminotransferase-like enzyme